MVFAGISFLSFGLPEQGARKIACIDGLQPIVVNSGTLPLEGDLFAHIQDKTQKENTQYYYNFLKQTEANYYAGLQSARSSYGLSGSIWAEIPKISYIPADLTQGTIASKGNTLWGGFLSNMFYVKSDAASPLQLGNAPQIGSPLLVR